MIYRAINYKFKVAEKESEYVKIELMRYIEKLKKEGIYFNYSKSNFEDFLIWYSRERSLVSVVNAYRCQEIINLTFNYSIDKSNEFMNVY